MVSSSPRVSVIIATYNRSAVLRYAIASVLTQSMRDFEVLVVGDGCTDDSEQVVAGTADGRVRWINLPENSGHQSAPNNRGLQEARGEFVAYLGHDDLWLGHHLECMIDGLEKAGAAFAHSLALRILAPDGEIGVPILPRPQQGIFAAPSSTMHRRDVVEKIGGWADYRSLRMAPETDFFIRGRRAGYQTVFVPRLTAIKFPASYRKNAYLTRPSHEQEAWSNRIRSTPNIETSLLVAMAEGLSAKIPEQMPIGRLLKTFLRELAARVRGRMRRLFSRDGADIDRIRKFKGL